MKFLFSEHDHWNIQQFHESQVRQEVSSIKPATLLMESPESLARQIANKNSLVIPTIDEGGITTDQHETTADASHYRESYHVRPGHSLEIPATAVIVHIPFDGDETGLYVKGTTFGATPPKAEVWNKEIKLRYLVVKHDPTRLKADIDRDISFIKEKLREVSNIFSGWSEKLYSIALESINTRVEKIRKDADLVDGLGFPVRRRSDAPQTYRVPTVQRSLPARANTAPVGQSTPQPVLDFAEYKHILTVCRNMYRVIERSPTAFERMEEEHLRDHFLVQLNGQYQGQATGETFNFLGKTDILVRIDGKNIFIAECKFWKGEDAFRKTLDQLLGYASWRDSRLALIIFNRNEDFTSVLEKVVEAMKAHPQFVSTESENQSEAEFSYKVRNTQDPGVIHHVTVLVFNVKIPKKAAR